MAKSAPQNFPVEERTVGVVSRVDDKVQAGYTLFSQGRETYLIDLDGAIVHTWRSSRKVFCAYLLPNGDLLRDGSENEVADAFKAGGAAGFVEQVTWDNEPVWSFAALPYSKFLTHHDLEPLPNGNVLVLCWQRKSKEQALAAGRRPELLPDGEMWDNLVLELKPNAKGGADIVWEWSMFDHLVQDYDPSKSNYGEVRAHPELFDVNFCPPGGKSAARNAHTLLPEGDQKREAAMTAATSGLTTFQMGPGKTGEKDWLHANSVSYCPDTDRVCISLNVPSEIVVVDHSTTMEEAAGPRGDIMWRYGNPQVHRAGSRKEQALFCQHSAHFVPRGAPRNGTSDARMHILLFNNGRAPDRHWSSVDEVALRDAVRCGGDGESQCIGLGERVWSYGPRAGHRGSFYCTHIGGVQRLANGNTLITLGPQGIVMEVTSDGEEVWRYVSPVASAGENAPVMYCRQGDSRTGARFSLFCAHRYAADYPAFLQHCESIAEVAVLPKRWVEAV